MDTFSELELVARHYRAERRAEQHRRGLARRARRT